MLATTREEGAVGPKKLTRLGLQGFNPRPQDESWVFDGAPEVRQGSNRWGGSCAGRGVSEGRSPDVVGGDEMYKQDAKMERFLI